MNAQLQVDVTSTPSPTQSSPEVTAVNLKQSRRDLLRGFQAVIQVKAQEERGVATAVAVGRKVRWEYVSQVGRSVADSETGTVTSSGNSANAQQVAENEAKKVCVYYQQLRLSTHTSNNQLI